MKSWNRMQTYGVVIDGYQCGKYDLKLFKPRAGLHYWQLSDNESCKEIRRTHYYAQTDITGAQKWASDIIDGNPQDGVSAAFWPDAIDESDDKGSINMSVSYGAPIPRGRFKTANSYLPSEESIKIIELGKSQNWPEWLLSKIERSSISDRDNAIDLIKYAVYSSDLTETNVDICIQYLDLFSKDE